MVHLMKPEGCVEAASKPVGERRMKFTHSLPSLHVWLRSAAFCSFLGFVGCMSVGVYFRVAFFTYM